MDRTAGSIQVHLIDVAVVINSNDCPSISRNSSLIPCFRRKIRIGLSHSCSWCIGNPCKLIGFYQGVSIRHILLIVLDPIWGVAIGDKFTIGHQIFIRHCFHLKILCERLITFPSSEDISRPRWYNWQCNSLFIAIGLLTIVPILDLMHHHIFISSVIELNHQGPVTSNGGVFHRFTLYRCLFVTLALFLSCKTYHIKAFIGNTRSLIGPSQIIARSCGVLNIVFDMEFRPFIGDQHAINGQRAGRHGLAKNKVFRSFQIGFPPREGVSLFRRGHWLCNALAKTIRDAAVFSIFNPILNLIFISFIVQFNDQAAVTLD